MSGIKTWKTVEPWLRIGCGLGEHPFYESYTRTLRFLDIVNKKLHTVTPSEGPESLVTLDLEDAVGVTADVEGEEGKTCIVGAKYGYAYMDRKTGKLDYITRNFWTDADGKDKAERMRFNDGNIDAAGRFWASMMTDPLVGEIKNEGALFRLDRDGSVHRMLEPVEIGNGIGWSKDNKTMYFSDSPTKTIWAFDFDLAKGTIANRRPFWRVEGEHESAVPDGFCQDEEECIWQCLHGAGKVVRIDKEGKKIGEVLLPTRCPTCPQLVGKDLWVTSGEEEMPKEFPDSVKYAGSLFRVEVGVGPISMSKWRR